MSSTSTTRPPFFALDLRALALWRMALGAVVLLDIVLRLRDLQAFYGDHGMLSRALYFEQSWEWPGYHLFLASGSTVGLLALFAVWAVAATCLMVGYHARLAGLVTWYFVASIQLRNPMVLDGGDDLLRLLLFWTPFLPLSARWSVDARNHPEWAGLPNAYRSVATFGVTLQVFVLYLFAALLKSGDDWWVTGDALYYTLSIDQFVTGFGRALLGYPDLLPRLTWAALGLEYLLAVLLLLGGFFRAVRPVFYVLAVGLHVGIACMLHFGIFMVIAIAGLTVFFPSAWLDRRFPQKVEEAVQPASLPPAYRLAWWTQLFCAFMIVMIAVFNAYSLDHGHKIPRWTTTVSNLTFEQQHWHFFAPNPFKEDGWYVLEVTTEDGTVLDGWDNGKGGGGAFTPPLANQRWRRWMQNLIQIDIPDKESWRESTLEYVAKEWQRANPTRKAKLFRLVLMQEITPAPGGKATVTPLLLAELAPPKPPQEIMVPGGIMTPPAPQE